MTAGTPHAILTRHFLRRFIETDLIGPDADRSQLVALVGALCFCSTVFISVTMSCLKYVVAVHTPGQAALASLDDKFFYIGLSMLVSALVAVAQWDALVVDARDAAILEPLPVPTSTIRRAKLSAVALLGLSVALVLNLAPSVVFPLLLLVNQRVSLFSALWVVVTHAVVTIAAAAFGYVTIVAVREALSSLLGQRGLVRIAPLVQGVLVIALGSTLLLLPGAASRVESRVLAGSVTLAPPAWFLGAYEIAAGRVIDGAPRDWLSPRHMEADRRATMRYRSHQRQFAALARAAVAGLLVVFAVALAAHAWHARRLPQLAPAAAARQRRRWQAWQRFGCGLVARDQTVRAGFSFTLAVIWRSRTHRLTLACATAVGAALAIVALSGIDLEDAIRNGRAAPRLLVVQPLLYGALLVGFRHAIRVPAELPANWGIRMGWRGLTRRYLAGVRRAAVVSLVLPALAIAFPLVAIVVGPAAALAHLALGFAGAMAVLEVLLFGYDKVPFTCTYVPDENMKALGPLYAGIFLVGASLFARFESQALSSALSTLTFAAGLLTLAAAARLLSIWQAPTGPTTFDDVPEGLQQLRLHV